jgi:hypothetical protein
MVFKWQFALVAAFIAYRSSNINVPLDVARKAELHAKQLLLLDLQIEKLKNNS